jgi:hypothetical protein
MFGAVSSFGAISGAKARTTSVDSFNLSISSEENNSFIDKTMKFLFYYHLYSGALALYAFYYAIEAGLSVGFCSPAEGDDFSKLFTTVYVLAGSIVVGGCLGAIALRILFSRQKLDVVSHNYDAMTLMDADGKITIKSTAEYIWYEFKVFSGWYSNRARCIVSIAFVAWVGLGIAYGMLVENYSFLTAQYWAVTSISTGGLQTPPCINGTDGTNCDMGDFRGSVMGTFMMVIEIVVVTFKRHSIF